jgi:hypothetical protein
MNNHCSGSGQAVAPCSPALSTLAMKPWAKLGNQRSTVYYIVRLRGLFQITLLSYITKVLLRQHEVYKDSTLPTTINTAWGQFLPGSSAH